MANRCRSIPVPIDKGFAGFLGQITKLPWPQKRIHHCVQKNKERNLKIIFFFLLEERWVITGVKEIRVEICPFRPKLTCLTNKTILEVIC